MRFYVTAHLYPPAQQSAGEDFEGRAATFGETRQPAEVGRRACVPGHVTRVQHVQRLEVVVDGVADDNFSLEYSADLEERSQCRRAHMKRTIRLRLNLTEPL